MGTPRTKMHEVIDLSTSDFSDDDFRDVSDEKPIRTDLTKGAHLQDDSCVDRKIAPGSVLKSDGNHQDDEGSEDNSDVLEVDGVKYIVEVDGNKYSPFNSTTPLARRQQQEHDFADDDLSEIMATTVTPCSTPLKRRRRKRSFRCEVCLEEEVEFSLGYTLKCGHRFCLTCLNRWVSSNPPTERSLTVSCPAFGCSSTLEFNDVRYIFLDDPVAWDQYTQEANKAWIERQVATNILRRCPAEHCNYTFFQDENSRRHYDCPQCHASFCLKCDCNGGKVGPAHPNISCDDRQQELDREKGERQRFEQWKIENAQADARFKELINQERTAGTTRACPKCKRLITKNGGCDHMKCVLCGHSYSWSESK